MKNMSMLDRVIRIIVSGVLLALILTGVLEGTLLIIAIIVIVIFLATSIFGICPLYMLFKKKTY